MQAELASTFHSRLFPLREAVDDVKRELLDSVQQQMMSVFSEYRFDSQHKHSIILCFY